MITQQTQIKLNLPIELKEFIESKADRFGMPIAGYIKHLILKDVADMEYPVYTASEKSEAAYTKARKEYEKNQAQKVEDIDAFFEEL